jgi:hypothetical protein
VKKHERDLPERLAQEAGVRLQRRPGADLIAATDASPFLDACERHGVRVLGAEGFYLRPDGLYPDMDRILDLSAVTDAAKSVAEAQRFVREVTVPDLLFDFTLDAN